MSLITCCTCPEPPGYDAEVDAPLPKYRNKCGCPSATLTCVSAQKVATLCGIADPDDDTIPVTVYKSAQVFEETTSIDGCAGTQSSIIVDTTWSIDGNGDCVSESTYIPVMGPGDGNYYRNKTEISQGLVARVCTKPPWSTCETNPSGVTTTPSTTPPVQTVITRPLVAGCPSFNYDYQGSIDWTYTNVGACEDSPDGTSSKSTISGSGTITRGANGVFVGGEDAITLTVEEFALAGCAGAGSGPSPPLIYYDFEIDYEGLPQVTYADAVVPAGYSNSDTEADALTRATETAGTSCTSRYDLRTTSFSLTKRTATYSVTATNLCKGRAYEGCVRLRKRRSYSGTIPDDPDTGVPYVIAYEDVAPDLITSFTPTAANTTDGVTTVETDVALPHEQGWEYIAESVHIWPVSAGCDCPTDYVAPAP